MSKTLMLINETDDECRIAIAVDGILQEMLIENTSSGQTKNNIYKGVVVQVQSALQAAFVDYGEKKHGFLPNSEINCQISQEKKLNRYDSIQQKLKVGQEILVQVTREGVDHKGAALTSFITLPGRFMVLMPYTKKGGISKKIDDPEERERLKSFLSGIESEDHSVIIRTAGIGRSLSELKKDYTMLKKEWEDIYDSFRNTKRPGLLLEEMDAVTRTLRDYYTEEIEEIWVDNPETFQKAHKFLKQFAPRRQKDLKLFVEERSLFASYNIENQVEQLTAKQVKLRSGGSIVIDQTEALVAIDVNSGKSNQEGNIDSTALRTNLEAADEIARQLRLRNMGGLIVIDFIDMENESYRRKVEERLAEAMKMDKAQTRYNAISQFGLLEMSRQRLASGITSTIESVCPTCNGKGKVLSLFASSNFIIRSIREIAAKGNIVKVEGELPLEVVNNLLNERRQSITELELEFGIEIILRGNPNLTAFNEKLLKPVYRKSQHDRTQDTPESKEQHRQDSSKKKSRRQSKGKDNAARKTKERPDKEQVEDRVEDVEPDQVVEEEPQATEIEEVAEKEQSVAEEETAEKEQTADKSGRKGRRRPNKKKPQTNKEREQKTARQSIPEDTPQEMEEDDDDIDGVITDNGIHPSALFTNVQELKKDELDQVTVSFENRLKGKIDNQPPYMIDDKYLWKNQRSAIEMKPEGQLPERPEDEKVPEESESKPGSEEETAADADTKGDEKAASTASGKKGNSSRRRKPRKADKPKAKEGVEKESSGDMADIKAVDEEASSKESGEMEAEEPQEEKKPARKTSGRKKSAAKSSQKSETGAAGKKNQKSALKTTAKKAEKDKEDADSEKKASTSKKKTTQKATAKTSTSKKASEETQVEKKTTKKSGSRKTSAAAKSKSKTSGKSEAAGAEKAEKSPASKKKTKGAKKTTKKESSE